MTCLNERIVGATFVALSGYAFGQGVAVDSSETMTVANIERPPIELAEPVPEPLRYLRQYEMASQPSRGTPFYGQIAIFYSAQVPHDFRFGAGKATPTPESVPQQASTFLHLEPSIAPKLSIVQVPNSTLTLGAQPQRRLLLTVNDWVFSATARISVLHSHGTGATFSIRHGF